MGGHSGTAQLEAPFTEAFGRFAQVGTFSAGIKGSSHIARILNARALVLRPSAAQAQSLSHVVGWGKKANTQRAEAYARRFNLPYLRLEDGFVRSVGLGVTGSHSYSLVVDDLGIYYDSTTPSRLERLLEDDTPALLDSGLLSRAQQCLTRCATERVSKYNVLPTVQPKLAKANGRRRILIIDQTLGDQSLRLGGLVQGGMAEMVRHATRCHPDAQLIIKSHPDVIVGKKKSALAEEGIAAGADLLAAPCDAFRLFAEVDEVYVGTSQLGLEALMAGKPVTCFGMPFYAGWGLTNDMTTCSRRTRKRSLKQVFAASHLLYSRYLCPETHRLGTLEQVIEHMVRQRHRAEANRGRQICLGFSNWKHDFVRGYLRGGSTPIQFIKSPRRLKRHKYLAGTNIVAWGQRADANTASLCSARGARLTRMEDGFLRSPGLGSDLTVPASLVVDGRGIYYDPSRPSDLEHILETSHFSASLLKRSESLRHAILSARISKYNVGDARSCQPRERLDKTHILVPGQVEDDASIRLGCRDVRTNLDLLRQVREDHPGAYILYKPHPDVTSGNRKGRVHEQAASAYCDEVVVNTHIDDCLRRADEVHTMTSLVGFEGLLRGLPVVVYGIPFYAGWGLTRDRHAISRRSRKLSLDMLVAGTLIQYPRYLHPETLEFITPEGVVAYLHDAGRSSAGLRTPWIVRQLKRLQRAITGVAGVR